MMARPRILCLGSQTWGKEFPPTDEALSEPPGLLAAGGDLAPNTLEAAYARGIFPWYSEDETVLWWAPDPRAVIVPEELHVSTSLARSLRRTPWRVSLDRCFDGVVRACAAPRARQAGTWLSAEMRAAYSNLHARGRAHSLEVWLSDTLVGGIYGVAQGAVFCGESMFSQVPNGSKVAMVALCARLAHWGYALLDCQIENPHLRSMGATCWPRKRFETLLTVVPAAGARAWQEDPFGGLVRA